MVIVVLLILSLVINVVQAKFLALKTKQMMLMNKIRIGYEKRYKSFQIRYTILSRMEDANHIRENIKGLGRNIYIYGNGVIGKKLYKILEGDYEQRVLGFLEGKELEVNKELGQNLDKNAVIVITPVFDYDTIVQLLLPYTKAENMISIGEIL